MWWRVGVVALGVVGIWMGSDLEIDLAIWLADTFL